MLGVIIHIDALVIWLTWKFRDGKDCWHSISIGWTGDTKVLPLSLCRRSSPCNGPWSWSWWLRQSKHFVASFGDKECSEMIRMRLKDLDMERFQNVLELVEMIWATFFLLEFRKNKDNRWDINWKFKSRACIMVLSHGLSWGIAGTIFPHISTMPVFKCRFPVTYQADRSNCCTCIIYPKGMQGHVMEIHCEV